MLPKHEPRSKFGRWLLKYRLKIILFSFVLLIPIIFVIALYVGDYLRYKTVTFDDDNISNFKSTFVTYDETTNYQMINLQTNELTVQIQLFNYLIPEYYDDTNGHYTFKVRYQSSSNDKLNDITMRFILQTDWIDAKSSITNIPLTNVFGTNRRVNFNHVLPKSPLWFVEVKHPNLYVELTYDIELPLGQEETKTHYFKTYLGNITPTEVTKAENEANNAN